MSHLLHNNRLLAVEIGGGLMVLAAVICYLVVNDNAEDDQKNTEIPLTAH
jgi:maltose/moltooligosaccharide transporter